MSGLLSGKAALFTGAARPAGSGSGSGSCIVDPNGSAPAGRAWGE